MRIALLVGVVLTAFGGSLWANGGHGGGGCGAPCGAAPCGAAPYTAAAAPCGPTTRTVYVTEWVAENYETTRTSYRHDWREEKYTAYRQICVPETRTRTVTCYKTVHECVDKVCTVWDTVPCVETRTVMKRVETCKPVTTVERRCVDRGHWECQEVPTFLGNLHSRSSKKGGDCCDPCNSFCQQQCVKTRTKKVWVSCKVWEEHCCTKMVKSCEYVPQTCQVTVCKKVPRQVCQKVCVARCVPECRQETYCCNVTKCVPYEACRRVCVCVPVCEKVTCCRMVPRCVAKQVTDCAPSCNTCCEHSDSCHKRFRFARHSKCCN